MNRSPSILTILLFVFAFGVVSNTATAQEKAGQKTAAKTDSDDKQEVAKEETPDKNEEKPEAEERIVPITIGSPAPKLDIEHWVQNGEGHFAKLTEFEPDKVYIVEFWATWCGPCIRAMPHIAQLQRSYADRGVQVVSITQEDVAKVEKFLDRKVPRDDDDEEVEPQTYRELTSGYCLTADPDKSSSRDYMKAANRSGIPCAFIVGKDAKIEWIGHPMSIDEPLEKIVTDQWNRDEFAVQYLAEQEAREIFSKFVHKMREKETEQAIAILDDYIANGKLDTEKARFKTVKFQALASDKDLADEASEYALELLKDESFDASGVNRIAWTIYRLAEMKRMQDENVLKSAMETAQQTVEGSGRIKPFLLDTVAHLQYVTGDRESALKTQQSAIDAAEASDKARWLTRFLEKMQREIKAEQEPAEEQEAKPKDSDKSDDK